MNINNDTELLAFCDSVLASAEATGAEVMLAEAVKALLGRLDVRLDELRQAYARNEGATEMNSQAPTFAFVRITKNFRTGRRSGLIRLAHAGCKWRKVSATKAEKALRDGQIKWGETTIPVFEHGKKCS